MHDFDLILNILDGNRQAFDQLIKKHQPNVFRVAIGLVHNKEDAEEITEDVFLKVYQSLSTFNKKSTFSTWLYRITINTSLNFLHKKKNKQFWTNLTSLFQVRSRELPADEKLIRKSEEQIIKQALDSLPQKQQIAFVLTKYEELSQHEVAAIMKLSEGAVEQLVLRAKNNLRKKLASAIGYHNINLSNHQNSSNEQKTRGY